MDENTIENEADESKPLIMKEDESIFYNKYFVLLLMGFSLFGQNFVVDNPAALQDTLIEVLHITDTQFSSFYSFYNWPNSILCIINGYIIDRILGCRLAIILFTLLMTFGQMIFAFGAYSNVYIVMVIGRAVFGFGGESIYVAIFKLVSKWFENTKTFHMAMSLLYCVPNMGSVINMIVMPIIYDKFNLKIFKNLPSNKCLAITLLTSAGISTFSTLCATVLAIIDKKKYKEEQKQSKNNNKSETIKMADVLKFPLEYWLIAVTFITYYSVIYPFVGNIKLFYIFKYQVEPYYSNLCNSLIYTISAVLSPFVGLIIDNIGYNLNWLLIAILATLTTHCLIAFTYFNAFVNSAFLGVVFTFMSSAIVPIIPSIMSEERLATAFGIIQSIQNFGVAATGQVIGLIIDTKGYFFVELVFLVYLNVCLCAIIILFILNYSRNGKLNEPAKHKSKNDVTIQ